ncbi:MAG: hypothetical protein ACREI8_03830 [Myxococcota bacterium]
MGRRRFDRMVVELAVLLDGRVPRFSLWQAVHAAGYDPEQWSAAQAERFCSVELPRWLRLHGHALAEARVTKLARTVGRFDPALPTPEEHFARLGD